MTVLESVQLAAIVVLVCVGSIFLLVGTIGLLRLPNVYNRMHATTKATTLGASSMFLAAAVYFGPGGVGLTSFVAIVFLFATAPTGAHVISRAAQKMGVPFEEVAWPRDVDERAELDDEDGDATDDGRNEDENADGAGESDDADGSSGGNDRAESDDGEEFGERSG